MNDLRQPSRDVRLVNAPVNTAEEQLVVDPRGNLSPSQQVDRKLLSALQHSPVLVSRLNAPRLVRR